MKIKLLNLYFFIPVVITTALIFFITPTQVFAAPRPICSSEVTTNYPGSESTKNFSNTELCQYQTACRTTASDSDPIQGIIVPKDRSKAQRTYLYFGGTSGGDPQDFCLVFNNFCDMVETRQNMAIILFNKTKNNSNNAKWLDQKQDIDCFIDEALSVAQEMGINIGSRAITGHSGGGQVVDRVLRMKPNLSFEYTLLFDACYTTTCQSIVEQNNRGQTIIYISEDTPATLKHSEETYLLSPTQTIGIQGRMEHDYVPNNCFTDHMDNPSDNQRCDGKAHVVYNGKGFTPSESPNPRTITQKNIPEPKVYDPKLNIKIPGLTLTPAADIIKSIEKTENGTYLHIPFIGEYIAGIYRFSVAAGSVIAIIMIIVAGLQWTISRGDKAAIGSAKKRISGAFTGLLLLIGSYTLLYVINPELLNLRTLRVLYTTGEAIQFVTKDSSTKPSNQKKVSSYKKSPDPSPAKHEPSYEKTCLSKEDCGSNELCIPDIGQCVSSEKCTYITGTRSGGLQFAFIGEGYANNTDFYQEISPLINSGGPNRHSIITTMPFSDHAVTFGFWGFATSDTFAGSPNEQRFEELTTRCPQANQFVFISPKKFRSFSFLNSGRIYLSFGIDRPSERGGVILHELGHSFGNLADEYIEESKSPIDYPSLNCATTQAIAERKWGHIPGTGYFPGCNYTINQLRSSESSLMSNSYDNSINFSPLHIYLLTNKLNQ